jgi:rod shape-determining protein MreD
MRGRMTGMLLGLSCGLLLDLLSGGVIAGIFALLYMFIGYFIGFTHRFYSNDDYTLPIIIIAVSDFIYGFFYYVIEFLLRGRLSLLFYLRRIILPEIIYTVAVAILLYKLLHMINNRLEKRPDKEV